MRRDMASLGWKASRLTRFHTVVDYEPLGMGVRQYENGTALVWQNLCEVAGLALVICGGLFYMVGTIENLELLDEIELEDYPPGAMKRQSRTALGILKQEIAISEAMYEANKERVDLPRVRMRVAEYFPVLHIKPDDPDWSHINNEPHQLRRQAGGHTLGGIIFPKG